MKNTLFILFLIATLITRLCAENRLFVDFHDGPVHPFGQMRTWPNALTREYCQAQLDGEIGEYIVMMRQTDEAYLIGAATNEEARNLSINLDFLEEGREYKALIIEDGDGADYLTNRETLKSNTKPVKKNDTINVSLACGGGVCILIE